MHIKVRVSYNEGWSLGPQGGEVLGLIILFLNGLWMNKAPTVNS